MRVIRCHAISLNSSERLGRVRSVRVWYGVYVPLAVVLNQIRTRQEIAARSSLRDYTPFTAHPVLWGQERVFVKSTDLVRGDLSLLTIHARSRIESKGEHGTRIPAGHTSDSAPSPLLLTSLQFQSQAGSRPYHDLPVPAEGVDAADIAFRVELCSSTFSFSTWLSLASFDPLIAPAMIPPSRSAMKSERQIVICTIFQLLSLRGNWRKDVLWRSEATFAF